MVGTTSGNGKISVSGNIGDSALYYKTAASITAPAFGDDLSSWTTLPQDGVIAATSGHKVIVAAANTANGNGGLAHHSGRFR